MTRASSGEEGSLLRPRAPCGWSNAMRPRGRSNDSRSRRGSKRAERRPESRRLQYRPTPATGSAIRIPRHVRCDGPTGGPALVRRGGLRRPVQALPAGLARTTPRTADLLPYRAGPTRQVGQRIPSRARSRRSVPASRRCGRQAALASGGAVVAIDAGPRRARVRCDRLPDHRRARRWFAAVPSGEKEWQLPLYRESPERLPACLSHCCSHQQTAGYVGFGPRFGADGLRPVFDHAHAASMLTSSPS